MPEMRILNEKGEIFALSNFCVWSYMAHPDSKMSRDDLIVQGFIRGISKLPSVNRARINLFTPNYCEMMAVYLRTKDAWERATESKMPGSIAGQLMLLLLMCHEHNPEKASVRRATQVLKRSLYTNKNPIERAWSKYKSVSHLWSALILADIHFKEKGYWKQGSLSGLLSLSGEGLAVFLSVAEKIRALAESIYPPRGARGLGRSVIPLFEKGETWRCPEMMSLPNVNLPRFPVLTDRFEKLYGSYRSTMR